MWVDIKERLRSAVLPVVVEECGKGYNPSIGEGLATSQEALEQVVSHVSCITIGNRLRIVGAFSLRALTRRCASFGLERRLRLRKTPTGACSPCRVGISRETWRGFGITPLTPSPGRCWRWITQRSLLGCVQKGHAGSTVRFPGLMRGRF